MNARALGFTTRIDEEVLRPIRHHFMNIAERERLPIGKPVHYDAFHPMHQVPGGMISNFRFQLANLGKIAKLPAVLEEVSRVRAEFGYPIMVTPYSQFFGVQAAINVMVGERYKEVTDEVLFYALGFWGDEEARSIDANVKDRLLSSPRAKELARTDPPVLSIQEFRRKFGGESISDDDKLLEYFAGAEAVEAMRAANGRSSFNPSQSASLIALIEEIGRRDRPLQLYIKRTGLSLRIERRGT
jgi:oxaloacetate decarboxylase alpha subunit